MKIILSQTEAEQFFYNALCNGLNYFLSGYGFNITYNQEDYVAAKESLKVKEIQRINMRPVPSDIFGQSYEDIFMEMLLMGKTITFIDEEGDGDQSITLTLEMIHQRVCKCNIAHLTDMFNENDDVCTADAIIQSVLFNGEIIFG